MMLVEIQKVDKQGNVYILMEPGGLTAEWRGKRVTVPAGFRSDGASVPRFFWRFVFPPGDTRAMRAAFVHDWIYRTHPENWTKEEADELFRELLIEDGMPERYARRAYWGVRLFGGDAWHQGGQVR